MQEFEPQGGLEQMPSGHEHRDVNVRLILGFAGGVVLVSILLFLLVWGLFRAFEASQPQPALNPLVQQQQPPPTASQQQAIQQRVSSFPQPRLQSDDVYDMNMLRLHETEKLGCGTQYDEHAGVLPPKPPCAVIPNFLLRAYANDVRDGRAPAYAWVDQSKGIVHIPIDRAMELLAQRGLPVAPGTAPKLPPPAFSGGNIVVESRLSSHETKQ